MEDLQDFSFSGPSAKDIASELKDDLYFQLIDDFNGPQTGDLLGLDERPCTNRLLVQVGLMREENDLSWVYVVKWLQKIFPMYQSADFRCLIDRNTETALSLTGDARESFLGSEVNFEFVGPVCDSIGIGRTDLLEMSDFSDRAKLTDITNGLMLELTNFIAREKINPVVLVSWLRNFDPTFCSDGKIQKANKLLKSSLKRFRLQYRNKQRSRNRRSGLFDEFLQSPFDFTPELEVPEFRRVSIIKGQLRKKRLKLHKQKSDLQTTEIKNEGQSIENTDSPAELHHGHKISSGYRKNKHTLEYEGVCDSYQTSNWFPVKDKHAPESSRSEFAQTLDFEEDPRFDTGDCLTLLDISILSLQKLAGMYGGISDSAKMVSLDILKNQFSLMLNENVQMKSLNDMVMAHALAEEDQYAVLPPVNFLQCNAHFLFDLIDAVEKQMMSFEREIVNTTGEKLGRDNNPRFKSFMSFDESAVSRYIHMACEILCPRGETNSSYRRHWVAFCIERNNPSTLPINQSNRFINYFEAAAALVHHYRDVALFVSDLQLLNDDSNIILDSVHADAADEALQALVCVVAIVYCKVLGPFWQLLKSDAEYLLFSKYILCLYKKLLQWSENSSVLLQPEATANVFLQVPIQEKNFSGLFAFCHSNEDNQYGTLMKACLQSMMRVLAAVMEENLKDFLPGGKYCKEPSVELTEQLSGCTFSQLMGEYPFGHANPYNINRPDKTHVQADHNRTEEEVVVLNPSHSERTASPEAPSDPILRHRTSKKPNSDKPNLRQLHKINKKGLNKLKDKRKRSKRLDQSYKTMIVSAVAKHNGPCNSIEDVDRLLMRLEGTSHTQKREAIRCELIYQKCIIGSIDKQINHIGFSLTDMVVKLKSVLPSEQNPAPSIITPPGNNVTPDTPNPHENPTAEPPQPFNKDIGVGNSGKAVILENVTDDFSTVI